ncbi:gamma-aminobutyric acid type B receptor subunit 2-like [Glandiceps talaboti]
MGSATDNIPLYIAGYFTVEKSWAEGGYPAAIIALDHVNQYKDILPGYKLEMLISYTQGTPGSAMREFIHQLQIPPYKIMVLGPSGGGETLALAETTKYWNLIQVGFSAVSTELSNKEKFPHYYRTRMPESSLNPSRIALLDYFGWSKVAILHTSGLSTDVGARIIITYDFAKDHRHRQLFCEAYKQNMFSPRYVWIFTNAGKTKDWWNVTKAAESEEITCTTEEILTAAEGYIVMNATFVGDGETTTFGYNPDEFESEYVNATSHLDLLPAYFANLVYDAVWSIALALNTTANRLPPGKRLEHFTYENKSVMDVINNAMKETNFVGMSGHVSFNENGDRVGKAMIYQFKETEYVYRGNREPEGFYWDSPISWRGGVQPNDRVLIRQEILVISDALFYTACGFAFLGLVFVIYLAAFTVINRDKRVIRMSSPKLNAGIIVGAALTYFSIVLFGMDGKVEGAHNNSLLCQIRVWFLSLGFVIGFGAMFSKTWRIHKIFTNKKVKSIRIKDAHLFGIVWLFTLVDMLVLVLWVTIDPLHMEMVELPSRGSSDGLVDISIIPTIELCISKYESLWVGLMYGYKGIILLLGCFLAWETRNVRYAHLNDSRQIGVAVYNIMVLCMVGVPTAFIIPLEMLDIRYAIVVMSVTFCTTITLCIVFVPKIMDTKNSVDPSGGTSLTMETNYATEQGTIQIKHSSGSCVRAEEEVKRLRELYRQAQDEITDMRRQVRSFDIFRGIDWITLTLHALEEKGQHDTTPLMEILHPFGTCR